MVEPPGDDSFADLDPPPITAQDRRGNRTGEGLPRDPDQPVKLVIFAMDIDTADEIADQLGEVSDHVYRAHSQLETSSKKNNETVQRNINKFGKCGEWRTCLS